ncbi:MULTISPECIES: HGxxPAAW family protein [unclassified Streptomyces]|uniref:HGxxPAAW family protein n=1 Tax=unclassified Streptomyces TaxID=2593676 RepID=UPI002DD7FE0C|nr:MULTISPECIES: HGxxPAAW family protein [unclassified Streptomyces]WSA95379.1 hypothetical protein OIE63_30320 [Streptomyces sp. NBC_01795]WSB79796.1 hypothetical protein OHB04_31430 [Streptomyces sp. NBC_01775]WSS11997.1 hypothetical protein OG533_08780 [Streptomyces sp. NBC_01186]WSS40711.1 hypothetical protein OG220_08940 [Streptomyces sp. NBC_01187]
MAHSHGHTPAAWTGVIIVFAGFCVGSVFMVMAQPLGVVAGVVLTLVGGVVGGLMRAAGLGQKKAKGLTAAEFQAHKQAHAKAHS